jgi:hypothetical protein
VATAVSDDIETAYVNALKTIEAGATYENTPLEVFRASAKGARFAPDNVILACESPRETPDVAPLLRDAYHMRTHVYWCIAITSDDAERKLLENTRAADLRKWLGANYTAGGKVRNFLEQITESVMVIDAPAVRLSFDALFHTAQNNPFSQA